MWLPLNIEHRGEVVLDEEGVVLDEEGEVLNLGGAEHYMVGVEGIWSRKETFLLWKRKRLNTVPLKAVKYRT